MNATIRVIYDNLPVVEVLEHEADDRGNVFTLVTPIYYDDIIRRHLKGELNAMKNHWIGIERGAVMLDEMSDEVTEDMRGYLYYLRRALVGHQLVFIGPLYDNEGVLRCAEGETIGDDALLESIDWLINGVTVYE